MSKITEIMPPRQTNAAFRTQQEIEAERLENKQKQEQTIRDKNVQFRSIKDKSDWHPSVIFKDYYSRAIGTDTQDAIELQEITSLVEELFDDCHILSENVQYTHGTDEKVAPRLRGKHYYQEHTVVYFTQEQHKKLLKLKETDLFTFNRLFEFVEVLS